MHGQVAPHARSVWADLDAIVLQEVRALRSPQPRAAETPFSSDDEFVDRTMAYLEGRGEEARLLMERLRGMLGLAATADTAQTEALQEPVSEGGTDDLAPLDGATPEAEREQDT